MNRKLTRSRVALGGLAVVALLGVAFAQERDPFDQLLQRAQAEAGVSVVPDHFLRAWDPITVFFPTARGPSAGGPEDHPERFGRYLPNQPGAWTWLDARTLQFRPAEPWPPLESWSWELGGVPIEVVSLMAAPIASTPSAGQTELDPVETVELTFAEPLPIEVLARMVTVELRPLGQVGDGPVQRMDASDFEVKALARAGRADTASYALRLHQPIPRGTEATVRFQLAVDSDPDQSVARLRFATAEPFRARDVGCGGRSLPIAPGGTTFPAEQALACGASNDVYVDFSARPMGLDVLAARNLVRFEPAVPGLSASVQGRRLVLSGDFERGRRYRVRVEPTDVLDQAGRHLDLVGPSELSLWFAEREALLGLTQGQGILERRGPQRVPVRARGHEQVDLRIYRVDPLNRSLWPFSRSPVWVNEDERPPGPGEELGSWDKAYNLPMNELARRLRELGTPGVSERVALPTRRDGAGATFGLDLAPQLERLAGKQAPGHYLVGLRTLDGSPNRQWMRVQVTDLTVTTVDEPDRVRFIVTRLSDGLPVRGAEVRIEGSANSVWTTLASGRTDGEGATTVGSIASGSAQRVVVKDGDDVLVLDPSDPPETFASGRWSSGRDWLSATNTLNRGRADELEHRCHIYTERPVYRPGDVVHIGGFLRDRRGGALTAVSGAGTVTVRAPGDSEWELPAKLTGAGDFQVDFTEEDVPTGVFTARYWDRNGGSCDVSFRVEAYRLPTFEVSVNGPDLAPLDGPFDVNLIATYYAGGRVARRPVEWRVTQVPAPWSPPGREGFVFATDGRYGRLDDLRTSPSRVLTGQTDDQGHVSLTLDPSLEPTAHPRTYVVEATVTGADDQTVTATRLVSAVPAVAVGLKLSRFLERAEALHPEIIVVGPSGAGVEGQEVTVRLTRREWHSHLEVTDYTDGAARYVTDVVDVPVLERTVRSLAGPLTVDLPIAQSGVYIVEAETHDRLRRASVVSSDLYVGGDDAMSWEKPEAGVFKVSSDKATYKPGEKARLVLHSPYQEARALVVTEAPTGNLYAWVDVRGGVASVEVPIDGRYAPRLPVHVVIERGRKEGASTVGATGDLGRPATVASTTFLAVAPLGNQLDVTVKAPERALPGETLPVTVRLADPSGAPLSGDVTLWLVDKAVLALGKEQRLDPIPDFIVARSSDVSIRDHRNATVGWIPYAQMPGGDGEEQEEEGDPLDKATVRRDFRPVPFFQGGLHVPASGELTVKVPLPDDLTRFAIRVKAASGAERLGSGKGEVQVRLPLLVQPSLPRFVRPGDRFDVTAIGRVVEGEGGAGKCSAKATGLSLAGPSVVDAAWSTVEAVPVRFPVTVDTPERVVESSEVMVQLGVSRASDGASDAAEVRLPLREDRHEVVQHEVFTLAPGGSVVVPALSEPARAGTLQRTLVLTDRVALARMAAALDDVLDAPSVTTEDRIAKARVALGLERLLTPLGLVDGADRREAMVNEGTSRLAEALTSDGRLAYWPGGRGDVRLTAAGLHLLVDARAAGFPVVDAVQTQLIRALERGLRSDCGCFVDGESYYERSLALEALAYAGRLDGSYWAELSRRASTMNTEAVANTLIAGTRGSTGQGDALKALATRVEGGAVVRLVDGEERYGGLVEARTDRNPLVLPSEARVLATMADGLRRVESPRADWLFDALVGIGQVDGWGSRDADAAALLALAGWAENGTATALSVKATAGTRAEELRLKDSHIATLRLDEAGTIALSAPSAARGDAVVLVRTRYLPAGTGAERAADAHGFAVERSWQRVSRAGELVKLATPGEVLTAQVGDVIEERVQVVNAKDRTYVAVTVPLAAGFEVLNPALATAPPEARPSSGPTRAPDWSLVLDDRVVFVYERLPKGTYDFKVRTRATTAGRFVQPGAMGGQLFAPQVSGASAGVWVEVSRAK